jgi:hypothetical protein
MGRRLFCELSPTCYKISEQKEIILRNIKDIFSSDKVSRTISKEELPNIVKSHSSILLRKLEGVDMRLQENKVTNIELACKKVNGILIKPGETFSFWKTIGRTSKRKGYKEGLVIGKNYGLMPGIGGGLCQMANMIHWLVLNSPLEVTELHHHTDAIFPDERRRVPFGTGTSVSYNSLDYRDVYKKTFDINTYDSKRNPLDPTYSLSYLNGEKYVLGEIDGSKPKVFSRFNTEKDGKNLTTKDIEGAEPNSISFLQK